MVDTNNIPSEEWEYKEVPAMLGGLNLSLTSEFIGDADSPNLRNVYLLQNQVLVDTGVAAFGNKVLGTPRAVFQFFLKDGSDYLTLITNTTFYTYDSGTTSWAPVSIGNATTASSTAAEDDTSIDFTSVVGYSTGDVACITLDSGVVQAVVITGIAAPTVTFANDPLQGAATSGNAIYEAYKLTGDDNIQPSITVMPAYDWMIFTNGVDIPTYFDGTDIAVIPNLPSAGNTICRLVSVFENRLMLAHTTEGGTVVPQRVRWSDVGDPTQWDSSVSDAGFEDQYDSEDFIIAAAVLGPYLVYYRERSIIRTSFIGTTEKLFDFENVVAGEGSLGQDAVVDIGDIHEFFGNGNIYEYAGGFDVQPVGDNIYEKVFSIRGDLVPSLRQRTFGLYVEELDETWFAYIADADHSFPQTVIRKNNTTNGWWVREFSFGLSGFGFYERTGALTWADMTFPWTDAVGAWNAKNLQDNAPWILLCGDDNQVYAFDYVTQDDDGTAISYMLETKDFGHNRSQIRFDEYSFYMAGTNIRVDYSLDQGKNWITFGTISPGAEVIDNRFAEQFISNFIRFRFSGSESFTLRSFSFYHSGEDTRA